MPRLPIREIGLCSAILTIWMIGCQPQAKPVVATDSPSWFTDVTEASGLLFQRDGGAEDAFEMPQIMGSGGGMFDYDNDGDLDVFLIGGGDYPPAKSQAQPASRLFRQDTDGRFTDVTTESGLINTGYGMGIAVGDADNDGDLDVFLSNVGDDRFFVNEGNGRFRDATQTAGVSDPKWSTACSFVDYNRDGWLDLVVVNYVDYLPGSHCHDRRGQRDFCGPQAFKGTVARLYRNRGIPAEEGGPQFEDLTVSSGFAGANGRGLGVLCDDFNTDGRPDILIANDMEPNQLWIQQSDETFREEAVLRGLSVNQLGLPEANMGVVYEDLDGDGRRDVFITHLNGESNTLWKGESEGMFRDITPQTGLGPPSLLQTGFGVAAIDFNLDGQLDILVVNGHVKRPGDLSKLPPSERSFWGIYAQKNQIFMQTNPGRFELESRFGGPVISKENIARGCVCGDVDNDGDLDILVSTAQGPARLYRNDAPRTGDWVQIRAVDVANHRDAYGAHVTVEAGGKTWRRTVQPSFSYLSHNDVRLHFGLGAVGQIDRIVVTWPDRNGDTVEEFAGGPVNQSVELRRGSGRAIRGSGQETP